MYRSAQNPMMRTSTNQILVADFWPNPNRNQAVSTDQMSRAAVEAEIGECTTRTILSQPQPRLGTSDLWQRTLLDFRFGLHMPEICGLEIFSSHLWLIYSHCPYLSGHVGRHVNYLLRAGQLTSRIIYFSHKS
jgi:hypothetical protein